MKKLILFGKDNLTLELSAVFLFILILLSNLAVIKFAEGYFEYFGISLGLVNFVPQMYDYERIALPVILVSVAVTVAIALFIWIWFFISDLLASKASLNEKLLKYVEHHMKLFEVFIRVISFVLVAFVAILLALVFFHTAVDKSISYGKSGAENMKQLDTISNPGNNLQEIIIYKGNGEIITKTYDVSKKEFLDGYSVRTGSGYSARTINR